MQKVFGGTQFIFFVFNYISENKVGEDFCRILWREILKFLPGDSAFLPTRATDPTKYPSCVTSVLAALVNYRNYRNTA